MPLTQRTSLTSTSPMVPLLSLLPASSSHAPTEHLDRSSRITNITRPSEGPNICSVLEALSHHNPCLNIPALSPPAPTYPDQLPVQVKHEETPISLQTLRQSQSLLRVKKELRSLSLQFSVGPCHRLCSPPCQQSLMYVTPPPGFLQCLHHCCRQEAARTLAPLEVRPTDSHNHHLCPQAVLRPPLPPIMSSPPPVDKEVLKLLLPLRYDGKTVIECNQFLSQLRVYWQGNTALTTIELKVQVALSLLDGDAHTWATPIFARLVSVQISTPGATMPFTNEAAFAATFKAHFGNLDNTAVAQVELAKLCTDKLMRERHTAAEFSALFKGLVDRSEYGDLELCNKYLSGIPSRVYRKIELKTFTT
ncbi:predicted protein [Postia placenta Mad-698-R]|nr:predicted protein [Postia placenta Mad-698-R]